MNARSAALYRGPVPWVLLGCALRILYWWQASREAWFDTPAVDPEFYLRWADAIVNGHAADYLPLPRAPLYPYVLAALRSSLGTAWIWPRLLNLGLDAITIVAVFTLARRLRGNTAAHIAAALVATSGVAIYFSGELLMASFATTLAALTACALANTIAAPGVRRGALAGLPVAAWTLLQPNALVVLPFTTGAIVYRSQRRYTAAAAHLLAALLPLLPLALLNYAAAKEFVPVTLQGGVNFYIGNARGADGWSATLPGVGGAWEEAEAHRLAEQLGGTPLTDAAVSRFYWRLGLAEIRADVLGWLRLLGRKVLLLVNAREMGNNRPLVLAVQVAPQMRFLFLISLGLMLPLALVGWLSTRGQPENAALTWLNVGFAAGLVMFFVNARFRLPLVPAAAIFAATGVMTLCSAVRAHSLAWRRLLPLGAGAMLCLPPWGLTGHDEMTQAHTVAGNAWLRINHAREALTRYDLAMAIDPGFPDLNLNRGIALSMLGDLPGAQASFQREIALDPNNGRAWNNLGVLSEKRKDWPDAENCYRSALHATPWLEDARRNLGSLLVRRANAMLAAGQASRADTLLTEAETLVPSHPQLPQLRRTVAAALASGAPDTPSRTKVR